MIQTSLIRILSLDGGNLGQSLLTAFILAELEERTGDPASKLFDIVAGAGGSAFVAAGLSIPDYGGKLSTAADLSAFLLQNYKSMGKRRFRDRMRLKPVDPVYQANGVIQPVRAFFGDRRLSEAEKELFLPVFDLAGGGLRYLSSWAARGVTDGVTAGGGKPPGRSKKSKQKQDNPDRDYKIADLVAVCMMDELKYPPQVIHGHSGKAAFFGPGGEICANPALSVYAAATALCSEETEIQLISVSAGQIQVETPFKAFRTMSKEQRAVRLRAALSTAAALDMDARLALLMGSEYYNRIDIPVETIAACENHRLSLRRLMSARKHVAATVRDLDLGFLA